MAVLKDLTQLGAVFKTEEVPPPAEAFQKVEPPPLDLFGKTAATPAKKNNMFPAYMKYTKNPESGFEYALVSFNQSFMTKHFKTAGGQRFELVQANDPKYKHWFVLRKAIDTKGNKWTGISTLCFTFKTDFFSVGKLDKSGKHYPLGITKRDGVIYVYLPPELVPLLR